jgi:DNA primase
MKEYVDRLWKRDTGVEAFRYLYDRGLTAEDIYEFELGYDPRRNAIHIPYIQQGGEIGARWRFLSPGDGPKYLPVNHFKSHIYNVDVLADAADVYVTEGEFDCMILRKLGLEAVGVQGTQHFKREWRWLFQHADSVTVCFDWDQNEAGQVAGNRLVAWLGDVCDDVRRLKLPLGVDVNDAYLHGELEARLKEAA